MSDTDKKTQELEALLFIYGEPMELQKIAALLKIGEKDAGKLAEDLSKKLDSRGLAIVINGKSVQLVTKPEFGKLVENIVKEELSEDLTPAGLETLATIAYLGPVSRSKIDYIRGVNSTFTLRNLLLRGLIDRAPDPARANAFLYTASFDFIRHIGIHKLEELPEFEKFRGLLEKINVTGSE